MLFVNNLLNREEDSKILVVGDVMIDEYVSCTTRHSSAENIKKFIVDDSRFFLGGAANVAQNISALKSSVILHGVIGVDLESSIFTELISDVTPCTFLIKEENRHTTKKTRLLTEGEETIRIDKEDNIPISQSNIRDFIIELCKVIHEVSCIILSDYKKGTLEENFIAEIIKIAKEHLIPVIIDPKGEDAKKYMGAHIITPNLEEYNNLTQSKYKCWNEALPSLRNFISENYLEAVILKDSSSGSVLVTQNQCIHIPALSSNVECTIGAGDSLIAGLAIGLSKKLKLTQSFALANLVSSIAVTKPFTSSVLLSDVQNNLHLLETYIESE